VSFEESEDRRPKPRRSSAGGDGSSSGRKPKDKSKSRGADRARRASEGEGGASGGGAWNEADLEPSADEFAPLGAPPAAKAKAGGWFKVTERFSRVKRLDGPPDDPAAAAQEPPRIKGGRRGRGEAEAGDDPGGGRLTTPLTASEKARKKSFMAKALRLSGLGSSGGGAAAAPQASGSGAGAWNRAQGAAAAESSSSSSSSGGGRRRDSSMRDSFGYRASADDSSAANPLQASAADDHGSTAAGLSADPLAVQRAARRVSKQQALVRAQAEQQLKEQPWMATLYSEEKDAMEAERLRSALREHREGKASAAAQDAEQAARSNAEREARERRRLDPEEEAALNRIKVRSH
jgi:hypothetical protein